MKAILICAGYATRLYPLTENQSKCLLPILGKPILNHILDKIDKIKEIDQVFIISNSKFYNQFTWWVSNQKGFSKEIQIVDEQSTAPENQKGGIYGALEAIKEHNINDDILMLFGDNYSSIDLSEFIRFANQKQTTCLACYQLDNKEGAKKFGVIETDQNFKILYIEEKPENPKSNLVATGIYFIKKQDIPKLKQYNKKLDEAGELNPSKNITHFIKEIYKDQDIFAFPFKGQWADIGTKEDYEKLK
ncbi:MAG: nucleotidyltransferase family protein [archaeon]